MCGITGFYTNDNSGFVSKEELEQMTLSIKHRGMDASGTYYSDTVGLGHRRLSIMDLSQDANQPMESHSMRYTCVYNGEVYNFTQIAKELGINLKTGSDTEVIIEAFAEWGVTFINKLNGMFAISIYDKQEKMMYLFRDRMGIKPIYYYWDGKNFAFASELKALLEINYVKSNRRINNDAINQYLHLGYIPEPNSIYNNIRKFPAGHFGIICDKGLRLESYWDIEGSVRNNIIEDEQEAKHKLKEVIEDSVSIRLLGDVPYGCFLSGGIDSSLVTAIARKMSSNQLNTFSVGFECNDFNEAEYARKIATHLGTNHTEYYMTAEDAKSTIEELLDSYDEPFADSSAVPTMMVSKLAKQTVSMVLAGDGGDELFHGYGAYVWAKRLSKFHSRNFKQIYKHLLSLIPSNKYNRAAHLFDYKNKANIKSHIFSQEQYFFSEQEIFRLVNPDYLSSNTLIQDYSNYSRKLTPEESQAIFDISYYLKDDLLVKVDRASMKYGIEVRVPLLDYRIVEFALNLSPNLKISQNTSKYLLKEILYDYLPKEFFDRPKKGFAMPLQKWLKNDLSFLIENYLSKDVIDRFAVVNYQEVERLKKQFFSGKDFLYNRLWQLIILHKFLIKDEKL